jgi:hypothetical protein
MDLKGTFRNKLPARKFEKCNNWKIDPERHFRRNHFWTKKHKKIFTPTLKNHFFEDGDQANSNGGFIPIYQFDAKTKRIQLTPAIN